MRLFTLIDVIKMNVNKKNTIKNMIDSESTKTTNYGGGLAFEFENPKLKLYSQAASWMVGEPKFYSEDGESNQDKEILLLVRQLAQADPEYLMKLAVYCRTKLHLRTAPIVLMVESFLSESGISRSHLRGYIPMIVQRADELTTAVAYLQSRTGHIGNHSPKGSMPSSLKKGLADSFKKFDEYQLAKYDNQRRQVKLRDVLRLTHPKPESEEQSDLWKRLLSDDLAIPKTWETIISGSGSNPQSWKQASDIMPYMATLRNLRNLLQNGIPMDDVCTRLTNKDKVLKSKQFPFRFFSAYREIQNMSDQSFEKNKVLTAVETAMEMSVENIPHLKGNTYVTADVSGSMESNLTDRSSITYKDISLTMAALANRISDNSIISVFAEDMKFVNIPPGTSILQTVDALHKIHVGYSTNAYLTIQGLLEQNLKTDRILLFSDMQCYDASCWGGSIYESLTEYRRRINPDVYVYSFDLSGYGTLQIPEKDSKTCLISGWSEKILEYIPIFESEGTNALQEIEAITCP
jgi:hypothetical protein